jgi:hypothetical protein
VKQYPEARQVDGLLLLRIDAPLYFANVNPVKDALAKYERRAQEAAAKQGATLHFIIIDLSPVYDVDASAIHFFKVGAPGPQRPQCADSWNFGNLSYLSRATVSASDCAGSLPFR